MHRSLDPCFLWMQKTPTAMVWEVRLFCELPAQRDRPGVAAAGRVEAICCTLGLS